MAQTLVALLRGVNVGKAKRVAMANLRAVVEGLGHADVRTLLNSGNVVFRAASAARGELAPQLEQALAKRLGVECRVVVVRAAELDEALRSNPLARVVPGEFDPARLLVVVLASPSDGAKLAPLVARGAAEWAPEALAVQGRFVWLWCPDGVHRSRAWKAVERALGDACTARNLATLQKLAAMAATAG